MTRFLLILALTATAASTSAANWPWQNSPVERPDYCKGFVTSGLSSTKAEGASRTTLWLAWNYLLRSTTVGESYGSDEFHAGQAQFIALLDSTDAVAILSDADGTCGLGRTGLQVTGW
ncbi:MAG: hypothetical protein DRR04_01835 [Gammaproteobacteria bacterium]|nr:MAG: hypothetical protein DRQ97_01295 [Gammaproteobacteria bacterium]RLA61808.1 MAG: hypothetical protein DRR04_01835 [Gammaproteobacteria bacterium]